MNSNSAFLFLFAAVIFEAAATVALKASAGFTKLYPSIIVGVGYGTSFWLFSHAVKIIPLGLGYAVWSGLGTALVAIAGWLVYKQVLSATSLFGIVLIVAGVILTSAGKQ